MLSDEDIAYNCRQVYKNRINVYVTFGLMDGDERDVYLFGKILGKSEEEIKKDIEEADILYWKKD